MKKSQWSWIAYDLGSSSYILTMTGIAFPIFLKIHVMDNAAWTDALWGAMLAFASLSGGLLAPLAGVAADIAGRRLHYLAAATVACCVSTALLALPGIGSAMTVMLFVSSYISYLVAASLYDALLKQVSNGGSRAWLSSLGWGLGYIGGLTGYLLCRPFLGADAAPATAQSFAISFVIIAAFYGGVSGLALLGIEQSSLKRAVEPGLWRRSVARLFKHTQGWHRPSPLTVTVVFSGVLTGAANALSAFSPIILLAYAGLKAHEVAELSAVFLLMSVPSTIVAGALSLRLGARQLLLILLPCWLLFMLLLVSASSWTGGLLVAGLLGLILGPTNAIARGMIAELISDHDAGEMFGLAALANRVASALGPLLFGTLSSASGNSAIPVIFIGGLLIVSGVLTVWRNGTHIPLQAKER